MLNASGLLSAAGALVLAAPGFARGQVAAPRAAPIAPTSLAAPAQAAWTSPALALPPALAASAVPSAALAPDGPSAPAPPRTPLGDLRAMVALSAEAAAPFFDGSAAGRASLGPTLDEPGSGAGSANPAPLDRDERRARRAVDSSIGTLSLALAAIPAFSAPFLAERILAPSPALLLAFLGAGAAAVSALGLALILRGRARAAVRPLASAAYGLLAAVPFWGLALAGPGLAWIPIALTALAWVSSPYRFFGAFAAAGLAVPSVLTAASMGAPAVAAAAAALPVALVARTLIGDILR